MSTLFRSAARVHPSLACAFVKSTLQSVLGASDAERPEGVHWSHVEVALWLLYLLGEGLPEATTREKGGPFGELMLALLSSSAAPRRRHMESCTPTSTREEAYSALFFSVVLTPWSEDAAQYRPPALRLACSASRIGAHAAALAAGGPLLLPSCTRLVVD